MSENIENSMVADFEGKVLEEKNPSNMFIEPVHVGQCPLCGGDTYSENDPSDDPTLSVRCCKCNWWENQFLTWEEMNCMIDDFSASSDSEDIYIDLGESREEFNRHSVLSKDKDPSEANKLMFGFQEESDVKIHLDYLNRRFLCALGLTDYDRYKINLNSVKDSFYIKVLDKEKCESVLSTVYIKNTMDGNYVMSSLDYNLELQETYVMLECNLYLISLKEIKFYIFNLCEVDNSNRVTTLTNEVDSSDRLAVDEFPSSYSELNLSIDESGGNEDVIDDFSSVESGEIDECGGVSYEKPAYINITFHRSTLELVKGFIGSMDREKSVEHLEENQRNIVAHGMQDFYKIICDALDRKVEVENKYPNLTKEEEELLKENMDN